MFSAILHKSRNSTSTFLQHSRIWFSTNNQVKRTNRKNLYSRISPLGDPSVSVVPVLDNWLQEGHAVNAPELQFIVKDLRSHKRFNQALEVSEWMSSKGLCPISASDQAIQLDLIGKVRRLDYAESYFQNLSDQEKTEKLQGALLNCYVREGLVDKSLSQMQKMKEMGIASSLSYNNIMCLYMKKDLYDKVPGVLAQMKEDGVSPTIFSYKFCINSYGARSDLANVEKILEEMENDSCISPDWPMYSMIANFYIKEGLEEKALFYLKKCEDKADKSDTLAYNHLISHYASLRNKKEMMRLWELQKSNCKKQRNREYVTMLGCLVKLREFGQAEELLREWESSGNYYDFRVPNILLIGYSQNGLIEKGERMLQSMVEKGKTPTPNSWSIIASGYNANENMEKAFQCMKEALALQAENKGWRPKPNIISSILSWASTNRDAEEIEDFVNSFKNVIPMNRDKYLPLIKAYVRCGKGVDGILESMKIDKIKLDEEIESILGSRL
ncbi:hypothetical protein PIB30_090116 [Stylosanthes scabra]|uniref:Pentatricopeptide repeat-containing protein n=1 Tax=Stylosanthes scabra TaxID=79078 RepID=A0ABU6UTL5_9FABA|nr:hypothetical protein [Stylosanthes scabra]